MLSLTLPSFALTFSSTKVTARACYSRFVCSTVLHLAHIFMPCLSKQILENYNHCLFSSRSTSYCFVIMQHALYKSLPQKPLLTHGNELPNPMQLTEDAPSGQHTAFVKCIQSFSIYTVISFRQNQLSYTRRSVLMLAHLLCCLQEMESTFPHGLEILGC